jgi:hypothetical protein
MLGGDEAHDKLFNMFRAPAKSAQHFGISALLGLWHILVIVIEYHRSNVARPLLHSECFFAAPCYSFLLLVVLSYSVTFLLRAAILPFPNKNGSL